MTEEVEVIVQTSLSSMLASATIMLATLVVLLLIAMVLMYRYFHQVAKQQNEIIGVLQKNVSVLRSGTIGLCSRQEKSDRKFKQLARRQYLYEVQQMKSKNYEQAKIMITRGEDVRKVIENCRISKSEAELILLANRMNRVA